MSNSTRITVTNITVADRKYFAMQLRAAGLNYREIYEAMMTQYGADKLPASYDERYVWRDIQEEMRKIRNDTTETAEMVRTLELSRLDQMQTAIMPSATRGDLKCIDRVLKIMAARADLLGLRAPTTTVVNDWRTQVLDLIKQGKITLAQAEEELGTELYNELVESRGESTIEGRFTEAKSSDDPK
jgi:hypothetical protein